jgi:hypothetical protein
MVGEGRALLYVQESQRLMTPAGASTFVSKAAWSFAAHRLGSGVLPAGRGSPGSTFRW